MKMMVVVADSRVRRTLLAAVVLLSLVVAACSKPAPTAPPPAPAEVTADAVGRYCGMLLADHAGPKGQIFVASRPQAPYWFSSVRDTIAFMRLPEEARDIVAVYVNDMAKTDDWEHPAPGAWVDARAAWFVVGSEMRGGMGAPEAVPFSDKAAAEAFRDQHGGEVVRLDGIADSFVLGPVDLAPPPAHRDDAVPDAQHAPDSPPPHDPPAHDASPRKPAAE